MSDYKSRLEYLALNGEIGEDTFGFDRYLNQMFYRSKEWKKIRDVVIARDNGCDLGVEGYDIRGKILIHHLNPITKEDILNQTPYLISPEYLICVSQQTHNAIHYGIDSMMNHGQITIRTKNDTCPWRKD